MQVSNLPREHATNGLLRYCVVLPALCLSLSGMAVTFPFSDDMEGGTANWTADAPWAQTTAASHSTTTAWTDSPGGYYANQAEVALTLSSPIDLSGTTNPALAFWHTCQLENDFDFGYVDISTDGGGTWNPIPLATFTGSTGWTRHQTDLTAFNNQTNVVIRFRLKTDKTIVYDGWTIDDVVIADPPNPVDLALSNPQATSIDLTWTKNLDATFASYRIYRSTSAAVSTQSTLVHTVSDVNTLAHTDATLAPNTTYHYRIYVVDTYGLAAGSATQSETTTAAGFIYPFTDTLEGSVAAWSPTGSWAVTTEQAYSGTHAWTDSPNAAYGASQDTSLGLHIDLGTATKPVLTFWHKYALDTESDFIYVEAQIVGTSTWKRLYFATGTAPAWVEEHVDLSDYAGKDMNLRFRLTSDSNGIQSQGWFIDDVSIAETLTPLIAFEFSDDMDTAASLANWHSSSWQRTMDSHSGTYAYTDSPEGKYGMSVYSALILANSIDLRNAVHPQLTFWHKHDFYGYSSEYDYGRVWLSTQDGNPGTWKILKSYSGNRSTWEYQQIDLTQYTGSDAIRIKFEIYDYKYYSDYRRLDGWTIDDVTIEEAPADVSPLTVTDTTQHYVDLAWTPTNLDDFARYEVYRSPNPEVTRSSTLVKTITTQVTSTFRDNVSMVQPGIYYYRIWVVDQANNWSMGSNEVNGAYEIPVNAVPFTEDVEGTAAQWSWGYPWGITDAADHTNAGARAGHCWTDSPGANYSANADTSLDTIVDLGGTTNPVLTFWHRYVLETNSDFVTVQVSTDDGSTWIPIAQFTGAETTWNQERVDLTPYAGNARLGLRFHLTADATGNQDGYYLDDLSIDEGAVQTTYPFSDDMEAGTPPPWFYSSAWSLLTIDGSQSHTGAASTIWTDSPNATYAPGADAWLQLTIDLGPASKPVLAFWHKYAFNTESDFGYIEVQRSGSSSWRRLYFATGTLAAWAREQVDLADYASDRIHIRFRVVADTNGTESLGWQIDDITINESQTPLLPFEFADDMDNANTATNWHSSSWELVTNSHSGVYAYTDSPAGQYGMQTYSSLILANSIDLTNAVHPQLTFWHKYAFYGYSSEYDHGRVYVSTLNGNTGSWELLKDYTSSQSTWAYQQLDLSSYTGSATVRIKFEIYDYKYYNDYRRSSGWTIDDVTVEEAPTDVTPLSVIDSDQHSVALGWTANANPDFAAYEIYRSTSPDVTRADTLATTIETQATTTYTDDVAVVQPYTLYYRVYVIDQNGNVSMGSNEVNATYTIPTNSVPFSDDVEAGTTNWSWGYPWGITDAADHTNAGARAGHSWTDSPGMNYAANANTALTTYLNLSATTHPILTFWHRYSLEPNVDFVRLEVSVDDGAIWSPLSSFTGTESLWNQERINLTSYAGQGHLGIRFRLTSDGTAQQDGYYLDDIAIEEGAVEAAYPFTTDLEGGSSPWFATSPWGLITLDGTQSHTGQPSTVWSDSPEGTYISGSDTALYLTIDLGPARLPVLSFLHKYALDQESDFIYVEVRQVGSSSWKRLYFATGVSADWAKEHVDLANYAGTKVEIRFRLVADTNGVEASGWHIDDVSIAETTTGVLPYPFSDDMETEATASNWHSSSWELTSDSHDGAAAMTDSPAGKYGMQVYSSLILANSIDLSGAVHPKLSFWHKYAFYGYSSEYDYGRVWLSYNNGQPGTWEMLAQFTSSQSSWTYREVSLDNWRGWPNIRIKFEVYDYKYYSDYRRSSGWTIDDVRIGEDLNIPSFIQIVSGNQQIGQTETTLPYPFVARIFDNDSRPRSGVNVNFAVATRDGTLSAGVDISDTSGDVETTLSFGAATGDYTVTATIDGSAESVQFTATAYAPGQPMTIRRVSGDNQVAEVNQQLANPFVVKVTDILDNPVQTVNVNYAVNAGAGTLGSTDPVPTAANGLASNTLTMGGTTGSTTVTAGVPGLIGSPITFTAYAVLPGGSIGDDDGDGMPNTWEDLYGLNSQDPADVALDSEPDELNNGQEYAHGTKPNDRDTDDDLMPDGWEVRYGLNPLDPTDANRDNNQNGVSNLNEYYNGTVPIFVPHFQIAGITTESMDFYGALTIDGVAADPGDEVAALDNDNVVCGRAAVSTPGQYGFMHVYADDKTTPEDEGADPNDLLTFRIWDAVLGVERQAAAVVVSGQDPPRWTSNGDISEVNLFSAGTQQIPLDADWNLFCFSVKNCYYTGAAPPDVPMLPGIQHIKVDSIGDVFQGIAGLYDVVRSFDRDGYHTYAPGAGPLTDMEYVAAGYAYWIKMNAAATLTLEGFRASASDTLPLHLNWNLVGYWGADVRHVGPVPVVAFPPDVTYTQVASIDDIFAAIRGKYWVVRSFDINGSHSYDPAVSDTFNTMKYAGPRYGQWIKTRTVTTISY